MKIFIFNLNLFIIIIIFTFFHYNSIECCWLIYIERKFLEWKNFLLFWFNCVLFFHLLQYHFEADQDSASLRADEIILKLQSAIFSFQSELKFLSIYKSSLFNFQVNWNWESRFCFNHHVVIFFIFSEKNIIFFRSTCLFISNFLWVSECLTQ